MKTIPAYSFDELPESAKFEADKGAMLYAAQVLLSSAQTIPATAFAQAHAVARKEWLDGWFDASGTMRFPPELVERTEPATKPVVGGENDGAN